MQMSFENKPNAQCAKTCLEDLSADMFLRSFLCEMNPVAQTAIVMMIGRKGLWLYFTSGKIGHRPSIRHVVAARADKCPRNTHLK